MHVPLTSHGLEFLEQLSSQDHAEDAIGAFCRAARESFESSYCPVLSRGDKRWVMVSPALVDAVCDRLRQLESELERQQETARNDGNMKLQSAHPPAENLWAEFVRGLGTMNESEKQRLLVAIQVASASDDSGYLRAQLGYWDLGQQKLRLFLAFQRLGCMNPEFDLLLTGWFGFKHRLQHGIAGILRKVMN